jgi:flagellar protein FliS
MDMEVSGQKAEVLDAADLSPLEILIQLYEGAIRFLEQAAIACEEGMVDEFKESLGRGQRIIEEFQRTLDFTQGSGVSNQLNDLYGFMLDNLAQAKLTHDVQYVQQVIKNLQILLDGWRGADTAQVEG